MNAGQVGSGVKGVGFRAQGFGVRQLGAGCRV